MNSEQPDASEILAKHVREAAPYANRLVDVLQEALDTNMTAEAQIILIGTFLGNWQASIPPVARAEALNAVLTVNSRTLEAHAHFNPDKWKDTPEATNTDTPRLRYPKLD